MRQHALLARRLRELLSEELGKYKNEATGQNYPALRVIPPPVEDSFIPESGIACAIWRTPIREVSSQGGQIMEDTYWKVYLAQRDRDESVSTATSLIQRTFTGTRVSTAMQEKRKETIFYERAIITIPHWDDFDGDWLKGNIAWQKSRIYSN